MFDDPLQWIVIGVIVVVIFLWGPQKIPELARGLGRAKREFDSASKEFNDLTPTSAIASLGMAATSKTADQVLLDTAQQLGIATAGKTPEQISQEIIRKTKGA